MKPHLSVPTLTLTLAGLTLVGCIHTHETVVKDESRLPVEFENDAAGRLFYEALSHLSNPSDTTVSSSKVSVPVVFHHERKTVRGPNTAFNDAVRRADTNRDGRITESEARIFASSTP